MKNKKEIFFGWLLLIVGSLLYFFANLQKVVVPGAIFNELQGKFGLSAAYITWLGAGFMYVYSFAQLIVGMLVDRYSGVRVMLFGGTAFFAGSLLSACDSSFALLFAARVLTGFGASAIYLSMVKMVIRISGSIFPIILGLMTLVGYFGSVVGGVPFVKSVETFGYPATMMTIGVVTMICYFLFCINVSAAGMPEVKKEVKIDFRRFFQVYSRRQNIYILLDVGIGFGSFYAIQTIIGKKFLEDFSGMSSAGAGGVLSVAMIIAACNGFLTAWISKLCGNRRCGILRFCGFGSFAGVFILFCTVLFNIKLWYVAAGGWILMAFAGNCSAISVALFRESNRDEDLGTATSGSNFFAYLVIAVLGGVAGILMEISPPTVVDGIKIYGRFSYLPVFLLLLVLTAGAALASALLKESYGKNISDKVK